MWGARIEEIKFDFLLLNCLLSAKFLDQVEEPLRVVENFSSPTYARMMVAGEGNGEGDGGK